MYFVYDFYFIFIRKKYQKFEYTQESVEFLQTS